MLNILPDDIIEYIINKNCYYCIDCNNLIKYEGNKKFCYFCKKYICFNHYNKNLNRKKIYKLNYNICNICFNKYNYIFIYQNKYI